MPGSTAHYIIKSMLAGGVGCFFSPASALAVGGVLNVMAACALGSAITEYVGLGSSFRVSWDLTTLSFRLNHNFNAIRPGWIIAEAFALMLIEVVLGTLVLGIAFHPVLMCAAAGTAAALAVKFLDFGLAILMAEDVMSFSAFYPREVRPLVDRVIPPFENITQ